MRGQRGGAAVTLGEALVSLRSGGPLAIGGQLTMHAAGAELNVAVALARLGHESSWGGVLGDDELGEFILRSLAAERVDASRVRRDSRPTGIMFLEARTPEVSRVFYNRRGSAGARLSPHDVDRILDRDLGWLHLTGITPALSDVARAAVLHAAELCRRRAVPFSVDINFRSKLWSPEEAAEVLPWLIEGAEVVIGSPAELALAAPEGATLEAAAEELLGTGVGEVVAKLGADGAQAFTPHGLLHAPAFPVRAVDTVGAGDAFTAGYLSARLDGDDVAGRLRRGCLLGAFAVGHLGDWEGLPRRDELALLDLGDGETHR
ncbi:PfkB domain-containing protein [Sinomonas atrocyanea]|uniref:PfkB domain-containing protein n=1 Tax=Sinomonas atrocyanea TaxID=37927 RepID=A0A126ZVC1_9MICC|nr:sugar kinase [Sinomonas atrocyanea]AMM31108.1 PfkB domain-containing protein [Sinomonas atrocyanea]GEB66318.1 ribokinase [Sinomonas atrocyanea]GGG54748.1 ribokinase [Sinomonas atrocyanea]